MLVSSALAVGFYSYRQSRFQVVEEKGIDLMIIAQELRFIEL